MQPIQTTQRPVGTVREYYVQDGPSQYGPHSEIEVIEMVRNGSISPTSLLCKQGWAEWAAMPPWIAEMSPTMSAAEALAATVPAIRTRAAAEEYRRGKSIKPAQPNSTFTTAFVATFGVVCALLLILGVLQFIGERNPTEQASDRRFTLAQFNSIRMGMTEGQVNALLGGPGTTGMETDSDFMRYKTVTWKNTDGSNITLGFDEGRVRTRVQFGLR